MIYNYKLGRKRVEKILKNNLKVIDKKKLPSSEVLTFSNSYYSWIASIFVDMRNSSSLFKNENAKKVSEIMKSFTSELIEILRGSNNQREIGIIGDCVYAIYTTPTKKDLEDLYLRALYCNTYIVMLNKLLSKYGLPNFEAGIGLAVGKTLVIKAGREHVGINDTIWIGESVVDASNLSSIANKGDYGEILMSKLYYDNLFGIRRKIKKYFKEMPSKYGCCYSGSVVNAEFNNWIKNNL